MMTDLQMKRIVLRKLYGSSAVEQMSDTEVDIRYYKHLKEKSEDTQ